MPDAMIIGAGPAGSLAAITLARGGWDVTLVEQHSFPRDKVCGECLSALGLSVLHRAGLTDRLLGAHPVPLTHTNLYSPTGSSVRIKLGQTMWGLSRSSLDTHLLEEATNAGVKVMQPARCESLAAGQPPTVVLRDLRTNERQTYQPGIVLLADGKGALLPIRPIATTDFGVKAHFADVAAPPNTIELFSVDGHYGGVAPIENQRWNAAFSVPLARLQNTAGNLDLLFDQMLNENTELRRQFKSACRVSRWLTAPLPRFAVEEAWPPGVIPLGNAAAALEPIGGEGMGLALRSAELAANALLTRSLSVSALRASYRALWRIRRRACRAAARILSSPRFAVPTVEFLSSNESLAEFALNLIGKNAC